MLAFTFLWGVLHIPCRPLFLIWRDSLTDPVLASFLSVKFLFDIPRWIHFYAGSFSSTSHADFVSMWEDSLTHPVLPLFLCREFLLHIPCCLDFLWREFLLYIPCWLLSSFFFFFFFFKSGEFLLHVPCCLHFYLGSFYTSRVGFIFI